MLKGIRISRMRGVRELKIDGMTDINVLIGRNGSGKSTVLEAIYIVSAWVSPRDQIINEEKLNYVFKRRTNRGTWSASRDVLWFMMEVDEPIEISLSFADGKELSFALFHTDFQGNVWLKITKSGEPVYFNYYKRQKIKKWKPNVTYSSLTPQEFEEIENKYANIVAILRNITLIDGWLLSRPNLIEYQVWSKLLAKRLDKKITELLRKEFERDAEDITYMPIGGMNVLAVKLSETTVRIDDLGDGARNAVLIAAILLTLKNTIVLIEEPESHQHPAGLRVLLDFMISIAKKRKLQLVISTHSAELVEMLRRICDSHNVKMRVFFLERDKEGFVHVRTLEKLDLNVLKKLGLDVRLLEVI